jgi:hypothetical protein
MEYALIAVCECRVSAENEREAIHTLSRGIEDHVTSAGVLKRLSILDTLHG